MKSKETSRAPILAAGGIVLREASPPRVAIVRLRKNKAWVLPKGKLKPGEDARGAARREVMEETGHDVSVHEYLGEMASEAGARPKSVQFWRMHAAAEPRRKLMRDVKAVKWLPLDQAIDKLTHAHERAFLRDVAPAVLRAAQQPEAPAPQGIPWIAPIRAWLRRLVSRFRSSPNLSARS